MPQKNKINKKSIVIIGGGITGLTSAYYLSKKFKVTLIERSAFLGGSARGFTHKNFILDYGPHKLYTELPGIMNEISRITTLLKIKKRNSIYLQKSFFEFPLKLSQVATKMPSKALNAAIDILSKTLNKKPDDSYETFLINRFGKTLYNLSFRDYAEKVWSSNPKELDIELAKKRVAISSIFELIKGMIIKDTKKISAEYFYYPPYGIKQLIDNLAKKIKENHGQILTSEEVKEIKLKDGNARQVILKKSNKKIDVDYIISTIYLDSLLHYLNAPKEISENSKKLKYQSLNILYLVLNKKRAMKDCWVFFPEKKFMFHRVSEQKAFSPYTCPKDKTVLMIETTAQTTPENIKKIISQLESIGLIKSKEILEHFVKSYDRTYPVYKKGFLSHLNSILKYLDTLKNIYTLGRPGLFNYNNMDQCWDMSMKLAKHIAEGKGKKEWKKVTEYFNKYRIVD